MNQEIAIAARKLEMEFFKKMNVYTKVPRQEALANEHKISRTRWLDVSKGDQAKPDYRARLVAEGINTDTRFGSLCSHSTLGVTACHSLIVRISSGSRGSLRDLERICETSLLLRKEHQSNIC